MCLQRFQRRVFLPGTRNLFIFFYIHANSTVLECYFYHYFDKPQLCVVTSPPQKNTGRNIFVVVTSSEIHIYNSPLL